MLELTLWMLALTISGGALIWAVLVAVHLGDRLQADQHRLPKELSAAAAPRFFAAPVDASGPGIGAVPIEVLLARLEQHVRLEQAAAESFHVAPTVESLHSRTPSPLLMN